jgi:hypothetical protein
MLYVIVKYYIGHILGNVIYQQNISIAAIALLSNGTLFWSSSRLWQLF